MDRFVPTRANYTLTARSSFIGIITALMATLLIAACGVSEQDALASVEPLAITVNSATTDSADLEGQTVSGTAVVSVEAEGWMRSVRFYLDGVLARTVEEAPFELEIDTTTLADGPHTLGIEAVMPNGRVRLSEVVEFFVANEAGETAPPNSDEPTDPEPDPEPDPDPEPEPDPEPDPEPEPDPKPEPDPEPATTLLMAASSVDPITAFDTVQETTAATGRYVAQPASVPASSSGDEIASVEFDIDVAGEYALWARLYGPDRDSDAAYIGFDGATNRVFTSEHGTWMWMKVDQAYLEAGSRRVSIGYGEPGLRLDVLAIVGDASIGAADLEHLAATESWPPHDGGDDGSTVTDPEPEPATTLLMAASSVDPITAFDTVQDTTAATGRYVAQPASVPASSSGDEVASVQFDVDVAAEYALWARLYGPDRASDAIYLGFDGDTNRVFTSEHGTWMWIKVGQAYLEAGGRRVSIGYGEPGLRLDVIAIVDDDSISAADLEHLALSASWNHDDGGDDGEPVTDPEPGEGEPTPPAPQPTEPAPETRNMSLRGDVDFNVSQLSTAERAQYDRVMREISENLSGIESLARSDNLYTYGRTLYSHVQSVMMVYRMTGDLTLLDHVDHIAELMRSRLSDGWRDTLDGTDGTRDGYLNWVYRRGSSNTYRGKDTIQIDEMNTHGMVAAIAYALQVNRDLPSPSGRTYGAHADFWEDYLVNHFEAKWRERMKKSSSFPIMTRPHLGAYYSWLKWHYYMGELTGREAYRAEANRMADYIWAEIYPVNTGSGTAYVWARSLGALGGSQAHALMPTTYARYLFGDIVEFHLEGFHQWASDENLQRFARTFTEFIVDNDDPVRNGMAMDIGGGQDRAGLVSESGWSRLDASRYRLSNYGLIAPWDATGVISDINTGVQDRYASNDTTRLAAGLFATTKIHTEFIDLSASLP